MHNILLKGRGIEHAYNEGKIQTTVLKGVNLDIEASKMTAIVGKSGSGKSTLLHILGTLDTPDKGEIFFQDINIMSLTPKEKARFRNRHLGFVYQFHHLLGDFSALENIMMPLMIDNVKRSLAEERARYLLERVGLNHIAHHLPSELSGGERQRVAIARALVYSPEMVLADEPTGNLDEANANLIFELFRELVRDEGAAVVMVTHDKGLASQCDNIFEMAGGVILNGTFDEHKIVQAQVTNLSLNKESKDLKAKSVHRDPRDAKSHMYSATTGSYRISETQSNPVAGGIGASKKAQEDTLKAAASITIEDYDLNDVPKSKAQQDADAKAKASHESTDSSTDSPLKDEASSKEANNGASQECKAVIFDNKPKQ